MNKAKSIYLVAIAVLFSPLAANAILIEVTDAGGTNNGVWEVTLIEGTFVDLSADLMDQEWWGDEDLAYILANTLGDSLGLSNLPWAAFFAFDDTIKNDSLVNAVAAAWNSNLDPATASQVKGSPTRLFFWATATQITSVPEPGTMGLLGLGLVALGLSRRKRKV